VRLKRVLHGRGGPADAPVGSAGGDLLHGEPVSSQNLLALLDVLCAAPKRLAAYSVIIAGPSTSSALAFSPLLNVTVTSTWLCGSISGKRLAPSRSGRLLPGIFRCFYPRRKPRAMPAENHERCPLNKGTGDVSPRVRWSRSHQDFSDSPNAQRIAGVSHGQQNFGTSARIQPAFATLSPFFVNDLRFWRGYWKTVFLGSQRVWLASSHHAVLRQINGVQFVPEGRVAHLPNILRTNGLPASLAR